jgi:hypothetical protein
MRHRARIVASQPQAVLKHLDGVEVIRIDIECRSYEGDAWWNGGFLLCQSVALREARLEGAGRSYCRSLRRALIGCQSAGAGGQLG